LRIRVFAPEDGPGLIEMLAEAAFDKHRLFGDTRDTLIVQHYTAVDFGAAATKDLIDGKNADWRSHVRRFTKEKSEEFPVTLDQTFTEAMFEPLFQPGRGKSLAGGLSRGSYPDESVVCGCRDFRG
jgi:hypothetical protein